MADLTWTMTSLGILTIIILMGAIIIWKTLKNKKSGFPTADERTWKINWKAGYYAMFMCQYFILAYLFVNILGEEFFNLPEFAAGYPMIAALLVSSISYLVLRLHFSKKGEP